MDKLLFVFNPSAGKAQIVGKLNDIIGFYFQKGYLVTVVPISKDDGLKEILEQQKKYYDIVVCAGGDGTLNYVISSCLSLGCRLPIGYLPMGSTNDFARSLGYSMVFAEALEQSCCDKNKMIDIGKFNDRYFIYVAAFGSLAEVSYSTSQSFKNVLGHFAYLLKGIQKITDLKSYYLELQSQELSTSGEFCIGLIMNSLSVGGFKNPLSAFVILDDGLFEVLLVRMPKNFNELQQIITDLIGQKITSNMFVYLQTSHLVIHSSKMEWSLDGEFGGELESCEIWNYQRAISIVGV